MQFNTYINIFMIGSAEYKECICRWNYDTPKFQVKSHRSLIFTKNRKKKQKSSKIEIETGSLYRQRCKRTVRTFAYCDETQSAVVRPSSNHRIGQSWSFFVARIGRLRKLAWHIYTPLSINGIQHSALTPVSPLQISIFSSSIFFFFYWFDVLWNLAAGDRHRPGNCWNESLPMHMREKSIRTTIPVSKKVTWSPYMHNTHIVREKDTNLQCLCAFRIR